MLIERNSRTFANRVKKTNDKAKTIFNALRDYSLVKKMYNSNPISRHSQSFKRVVGL